MANSQKDTKEIGGLAKLFVKEEPGRYSFLAEKGKYKGHIVVACVEEKGKKVLKVVESSGYFELQVKDWWYLPLYAVQNGEMNITFSIAENHEYFMNQFWNFILLALHVERRRELSRST